MAFRRSSPALERSALRARHPSSPPGALGWALALALALAFAPTGLAQTQGQPPEPAHPDEELPLGAPSAFDLSGEVQETVAVPPGTRLRERPEPGAPALMLIEEALELPVIERRGSWTRVRYGDWVGWIPPPGTRAEDEVEPAGFERRVVVEFAADDGGATVSVPEADLEARARELLGTPPDRSTLGPYELLSDVRDRRLLARLDQIAQNLAGSYRERFGLEPKEPTEQIVALFAEDSDNRRFLAEMGIEDRLLHGYATRRLALVPVGGRRPEEVRRLLVHELTHLLNRAALGSDLPEWLEEGLAEELSSNDIRRDGRLALGSLTGDTVITSRSGVVATGSRAALGELLVRRQSLEQIRLTDILADQWPADGDAALRRARYAYSAFFVRFLLEADEGRRAASFRAFLAEVAAGEPPRLQALLDRLGTDVATLDGELAAWLQLYAMQQGVPTPKPGR